MIIECRKLRGEFLIWQEIKLIGEIIIRSDPRVFISLEKRELLMLRSNKENDKEA